MDRKTFGKINSNGQRPRVDRFVAPRDAISGIRRRHTLGVSSKECNDFWYTNLHKKKYTNYLDEVFGLEPLKVQDSWFEPRKEDYTVQTWPCIPRKKRYLSSADSVLDLPTYSYAAFPDLLDWSNDNILVAALGTKYYKWSWRSQSLVNEGITRNKIQCCKFDPTGELLVLGTDMKTVEIHHSAMSKMIGTNYCRCKFDNGLCFITAIDWSPTGNSFVAGCCRGVLTSYQRNFQLIKCRRVIRTAVLMVKVSPDARYVAVAAVDSSSLLVLTWPTFEPYSKLNSDWTVKTIAWHPWRSALLGIGAVTTDMQARVAFWDAPPARIRETTIDHYHYSLDTMLFSHQTGELVMSLWNSDRESILPKPNSQLVVLSDPETVVDQWGEGRSNLDRVRTMVFSPDGTKLATATADEDLIIWNFLSEDDTKKTKEKRFSAIPVYLDEFTLGYSLR